MLIFVIVLILAALILGLIVLVQNPKGGGLAGSFGGLGNQMMGAKQSTDVVEKGTWVAASVLLALTLLSFMLAPKTKTDINQKTRSETVGTPAPAPAPTAPAPNAQIPAAAPQEGQTPAQPQQGANQPAQTPPATAVPQPSNTAPATK